MPSINEDSPNTLAGSFTKDLLLSKFWLCDKLRRSSMANRAIENGTILVLGSWYGNLGLVMLSALPDFKTMILVDKDPSCIRFSTWLYNRVDPRLESRLQDANDVDYSEWQGPLLVINTSCNDMEDRGWFQRIPKGTVVALQSRSSHETLDQFVARYPLQKTMYVGTLALSDPETSYKRFMKIGLA